MSTPEPAQVASVPSPGLTPAEVVLAQLAALQREPFCEDGAADTPVGESLRRAWEFASPGNRAATGPLPHFAMMLRSPAYGGLLGHRAATLGPLLVLEDQAQVEVLLVTARDEAIGFTWVLGRQEDPPYDGCWMTDGVLRHGDRPER